MSVWVVRALCSSAAGSCCTPTHTHTLCIHTPCTQRHLLLIVHGPGVVFHPASAAAEAQTLPSATLPPLPLCRSRNYAFIVRPTASGWMKWHGLAWGGMGSMSCCWWRGSTSVPCWGWACPQFQIFFFIRFCSWSRTCAAGAKTLQKPLKLLRS